VPRFTPPGTAAAVNRILTPGKKPSPAIRLNTRPEFPFILISKSVSSGGSTYGFMVTGYPGEDITVPDFAKT
jgi:hypothetical protein